MKTLHFSSSQIFLVVITLLAGTTVAQTSDPDSEVSVDPQRRALLMQDIDEKQLVTLHGNTRPEANLLNDRGAVAEDFSMDHMLLQLRRPPELERALVQFIDQLHDRKSPNYHHWLTAQQFGERYGLAQEDLDKVIGWLQSHGFSVNVAYPNGTLIDFSGTAGQIRETFHTEIHNLEVNGEKHFANMTDPRLPAALAPVVVGVVSMNDFKAHPMHRPRPEFTVGSGTYRLVPADLATIYNFNPLFAAGYSGKGQTIVVLEDSDVFSTADWTTFRSRLGLSGYTSGSFTQVHPPSSGTNNCTPPGVNDHDGEAILDAEWASAAAPNAAIMLAACASVGVTTFGGHIALLNLLNASSTPPAIVSISYGDSETYIGASYNSFVNSLYQEAVMKSVSVFVAAGDHGAAASDYLLKPSDPPVLSATHGINVNGLASTPTTWLWAEPISSTPMLVPRAPTGTRRTRQPMLRRCPTFRRFLGTILAAASC